MIQKLKEITLEILAAGMVVLGVGFVTLYVVETFSFLSLLTGMIGYFILRPAVIHYKKEFENIFFE
jgi:multisubunit Na+/H+ antiporter MnhG subunit